MDDPLKQEKYVSFWENQWNGPLKQEIYAPLKNMLEIFLVESPADVFSESMERIANMIRSPLKNRMGDSLLDALLRTYKNSGHLQFWEGQHLDNIFHCDRNLMKSSSSMQIWKPRFVEKEVTCAKVFNFNPEPPTCRRGPKSGTDGWSQSRNRNMAYHKRQLVLKEVFECTSDVTNLEPNFHHTTQQKPTKRKLDAKADSPKKTQEKIKIHIP